MAKLLLFLANLCTLSVLLFFPLFGNAYFIEEEGGQTTISELAENGGSGVSGEEKKSRAKLALFYEAMCPFCRLWILSQLRPALQKVGTEVELAFVPYGNVRILPDGTRKCQHGKKECNMNRLHLCALDIYGVNQFDDDGDTGADVVVATNDDDANKDTGEIGKQEAHQGLLIRKYHPGISFIICSENKGSMETCAEFVRPNSFSALQECMESEYGESLVSVAEQVSIDEKYEYVPWIKLNGEVSSDAHSELLLTLCKHGVEAACNEDL